MKTTTRKGLQSFSRGLILGAAAAAGVAFAAVGSNENCIDCIANRPLVSGFDHVLSLAPQVQSAVMSFDTSLPWNRPQDNVAHMFRPTPQVGQSSYLNIIPNEQAGPQANVRLPGSDMFDNLSPRFESAYWNWNVPSYTQWLPLIY